MSSKKKHLFPPGTKGGTAMRVPYRLRRDAGQVAWLAYLQGGDPEVATWAYVKRNLRREKRSIPFSQMDPPDRRRLLGEEEEEDE